MLVRDLPRRGESWDLQGILTSKLRTSRVDGRRRKIVDKKVLVNSLNGILVITKDNHLADLILLGHVYEEIIEKLLLRIVVVLAPDDLKNS